ncbi:MAG TPA: MATE family efflux transporter [Methanospirillum sp.]|nr:MATE family efflux transporter [Methanospirillum sp.]
MRTEITDGNLLKGLITVSSPIIVSNILQSVVEVVDLFFVGKLGPDAIAGVAMSMMFILAIMTIIIGVVTATTAFISHAWGAKEYDSVGTLLIHALLIGAGFAVVFAAIGLFGAEHILLLLGATGPVAEVGGQFLRVILLGNYTMVALWILSSAYQSCGNSKTPMQVMIGTNIINIILNPLLIFGYGIIPAFGVTGSALATIFGRTCGLAVLLSLIFAGKGPFRFPEVIRFDYSLAKRLFVVAIPNAIQNGVRSFSFLALTAIVAVFGAAALSAYGIVIRMELIALMPGFAIATGTAVVVGQNLGAKKPERAILGVHYSLLFYGVIMALLSALYFIGAAGIIEFFDPSGTSTLIGTGYFRMVAPFYILTAISIILSFAMNGAGATRIPMYATSIALIGIQIPLALFLPTYLGNGITGVWYAVIIGNFVQAALLFMFFIRKTWLVSKI